MLLTHRYYDPAEGRFLNRDPIGYSGGVNLYAYCGNNPVERLDPSGLFEESELDAWEQLSGAKGFLNAFSAGWSRSANDSRNALLAQAGADDYACKSPLGMEAMKYGAYTTAGMMLDLIPMPAIGFIDDVAKTGSKAVNARITGSVLRSSNFIEKQLSTSDIRAIRSLKKKISEHWIKYKGYQKNPELYDIHDKLKNAPNNKIRENIMRTYKQHMRDEIRAFIKEIRERRGY